MQGKFGEFQENNDEFLLLQKKLDPLTRKSIAFRDGMILIS